MLLASAAADPKPLIIGHRGASGHRPEHTLESYRLASEMGADFIEPDLVSTKDGVLVARHENEIGGTTDVAVKFPDRKATKTIDRQSLTGWFTEDFTLAELKTLRANERLAFRSHEFDGRFEVPTFDEVIELAQKLGRDRGRTLGIYPETKHPTYFRGIGLPLEQKLLASLAKYGWDKKESPVFIQSFESDNLKDLRKLTPVRLIQLTDVRSPERLTDAGLKAIAQYADGIGPDKSSVIPVAADRTVGPPTDLVQRAHAAGLLVHIYTIRIDKEFLSPSYDGHPELEYQRFAALGVDGMFTDFPDAAVKALRPAK
ncbi:MAG TPA: glycerophosphodiester phosphodiesterase [Vicinamibacterales bacterium]|nr:glycerophosphodiester phosphodiesterase [Vicinamibacterales bacterium]